MICSKITKIGSRFFKRHGAKIAIGVGLVLMGGAGGLTILSTMKMERELEEKSKEKELTKGEKAKVVAKHYAVPAAMFIAGGTLVVGANVAGAKRAAMITAACGASETALKRYKDCVKETISNEDILKINEKVAEKRIKESPKPENEMAVSNVPTSQNNTSMIEVDTNDLCFDVYSGRYFKSTSTKIRESVSELNYKMLNELYISLNDYYYSLGLKEIALGEDIGWDIKDGQMDVSFTSNLTEDGTPCVVVQFNNDPVYNIGQY